MAINTRCITGLYMKKYGHNNIAKLQAYVYMCRLNILLVVFGR